MNYGKNSTKKREKELTSKGTMIRKKFSIIFLKTLLFCLFAFIIVGGCAGFGLMKGVIDAAPEINLADATPTGFLSTVLDKEGKQTATLVATGSNRVYATIDEIPIEMQHAIVAIEDERFYEHNGIDLKGILRAGVKGITSGKFSEGASTITQQLLKNNVFTSWTSESSFADKLQRKIQEQYLAIQLEKKVSKDWILENYLNTINLGQNTLGVQAASRRYFGKDVSELNLSESAVIASITQNPSRLNPISNPDKNAERREKVLNNMLKLGYISEGEYNSAMKDDVYDRIQVVNTQTEEEDVTSYFVDALTDQVIQDFIDQLGYTETQAYKALYNGGLTIESTQDPAIQAICDEEVNNLENYPTAPKYSFSYRLTVEKADGSYKNYSEQTMLYYYQAHNADYSVNFASQEEANAAIEAYKAEIMEPGDKIVENGESITYTLQPQTALTVINQSTGEVVALVGGRGDKTASKTLNRAASTTRQPGSTYKVLAAYAPALDSGGLTLASVQDDAPYSYENGTSLRNYDNSFRGFTPLREAITHSINIVTVKTLTEIGTNLGFSYLQDFGFTTLVDDDNNQALALGGITNGVTNLELTAAYASVANEGTYIRPRFYTRILDHDGNVLIDNTPQTHGVLKSSTAWLLTDAMKDVVTSGTGTAVNFSNMEIAGKTGTTTKNRDALFAGFTPYYTCVVWGGYDDNTPQAGGTTSYPKKIWRAVMSRIHENLEYKDFVMPSDITTATVCKKSGKLAVAGLCDCDPRGSMIQTEYFAEGTVPTEHCDHHVNVTVCAESGMLATDFCPNRVSGVYITGGTPGSADEPYLLSEGSTTNTCPLHTTPQQEPVNLPDIDFEDGEVRKDKDDKRDDKKDDKNDDKKEDQQEEPKDENESDED
ncbi:MAG: PBP1A family penicillin-binding protein [Lachnospiraceae bacterium]|nr:PBP1A family penicillin-binding protein [Lachnospiraceae bacterium]MDE6981051.1 PBP1A family penicillin-binding protein [Lachnospiraceae bacterium]